MAVNLKNALRFLTNMLNDSKDLLFYTLFFLQKTLLRYFM